MVLRPSSVVRLPSSVRPPVNTSHFRLLLKNRWPDPLQTWWWFARVPLDLNLFTRWRSNFFLFFEEFLHVFAIFDFFSRTVAQIVMKLGGNVPCRKVTQSCTLGGVTLVSWFLTNFSIWVLTAKCIHSYVLLCKSMGNLMLIHNFDFFSKTDGQIHSKLGGNVPWVGFYQVCTNGHGPVIFGFFMNFFVLFFRKIFKNLLLQNHQSELSEIWQACV